MIDAMKQALEALEWHEEQDEEIRYNECPSRAAMTALRQAIAEAEKQPSTSGIIFAVEQSIEAGDCPMGIELAYDDYEAKRKESTLQEISDIGQEIEESTNATKPVAESDSDYGLQEPVAWVKQDICEGQFMPSTMLPRKIWLECEKNIGFPIYTAPVKREQDNPKLQLDAIERAYFHGKQQGIAENEAIKREWIGLTDEDVGVFKRDYQSGEIGSFVALTIAIEAKLKEKNT
jgi:hypothetical protein